MAQINFTIPDDKIGRVTDAFADVFGFVAGQGQTKAQFTKTKIRDYIKEIVARSEGRSAQKTAIDTVQSSVDSIDIT